MMTILEALLGFVLVAVPCGIIGVLFYFNRDNNLKRYRQLAPKKYTVDLLDTSGEYWVIRLRNTATGRIMQKIFKRQVVLGRYTGYTETGSMFGVDTDMAMSRKQCELSITPKGIIVSNLSRTNMTYHNGRSLDRPDYLVRGDTLGMGNYQYVVTEIQKTKLMS